ncbi:hypothetical protein T492DRAFT_896656 [Pavlovales sp. CCMP2436]|nr:hypothetical protein T492DRAFT_896656 [Pavlovales sp. CCMP2436]
MLKPRRKGTLKRIVKADLPTVVAQRALDAMHGSADIPRLVDSTLPSPLCLMTVNEILRSIWEDIKTGGIEDIGPLLGEKMGVPTKPENADPNMKRNDLVPLKYGVKFDANHSTCVFTSEYCERAGLGTITNEFGKLDCKLRDGQGWAEMVFGTTLTRGVVDSGVSLGKVLEALFDPKRKNAKKLGESCKVLEECAGHDYPKATHRQVVGAVDHLAEQRVDHLE